MRAIRLVAALVIITGLLGLESAALAGGEPKVRVKPGSIVSGETVAVRGSGFKARARVALLIGPPRSEADRVASARTNSRGRFKKRLEIVETPGRWILLACRAGCSVKAQDAFKVVGG